MQSQTPLYGAPACAAVCTPHYIHSQQSCDVYLMAGRDEHGSPGLAMLLKYGQSSGQEMIIQFAQVAMMGAARAAAMAKAHPETPSLTALPTVLLLAAMQLDKIGMEVQAKAQGGNQ